MGRSSPPSPTAWTVGQVPDREGRRTALGGGDQGTHRPEEVPPAGVGGLAEARPVRQSEDTEMAPQALLSSRGGPSSAPPSPAPLAPCRWKGFLRT